MGYIGANYHSHLTTYLLCPTHEVPLARGSTTPKKRGTNKTKTTPPKPRARRKAPARPAKGPVKGRAGAKKPVEVGRTKRTFKGRALRLLGLLGLLVLAMLAIDVALLWERVGTRMAGRAHDEPARITGVVPRLQPGASASAAAWQSTWEQLGYRSVDEVRGPGQFQIAGARWVVFPPGGAAHIVRVRDRTVRSIKRLDDDSDVPALEFPLPALSLLTNDGRERRSVVPLSDIPVHLQRAVVAIEDERFYKHVGVDPRGVARAMLANLQARGVAQGGSTITQQLAKNMFLSADRTMVRKGQEALIAGVLEARYSKDRILEAYLNEIYLGQRGGFAILGVAEAARAWFGKGVGALTLSESALLAGAIHAPNRLAPWKHPEAAKERRDRVLAKMRALQAAPEREIDRALAAAVTVAKPRAVSRSAPWFIDGLVASLRDRYTPEALHRDGLELVTTLDPRLQRVAEDAATTFLAALKTEQPALFANGAPQLALLALDPRDGSIRAHVGGGDYGVSQFDRVADARRQPGSAMKPIVLASALQARWPHLGPNSVVLDVALSVDGAGPGGTPWSPGNWDGRFRGPMSLRRATELSRNLPFVRLGMNTGLDRLVETAHVMGIESSLRAVPSLAIGSQEVSPLELAVTYATLANGGRRVTPRSLEGVRARDGAWLERNGSHTQVGIDPRVAAVVTDILSGVVERGTGKHVRAAGFEHPVAAKTGTSNDSRDGWMVGYTPDLVVVAWVGFDQERSLGLPSTRTAVPLWTEFMVGAQPFLSGASFARPAGLQDLLDDPLEDESLFADEEPSEAAAAPKGPKGKARKDKRKPKPQRLLREDRKRRKDEARALREME